MTDNYEFMRSSQSQSTEKYSPYVKKEWNYVPDINNGVYTNTNQSLVQFDLSSIFNSSRFVDTNDIYFTLPVQLVAAVHNSGATPTIINPATVYPAGLFALKSGFHNLIHQADLQINGKTVEQTQPYINKFVDFKLLSEMSVNDLQSLGPSLGYSEEVDNPFSVRWEESAAFAGGHGVCNNRPFGNAANVTGSRYPQLINNATQFFNCSNTALSYKIATTISNEGNKLVGTGGVGTALMLDSAAAEELRPRYFIENNQMIINDVAVIKLRDLFDSMANIGLVRRFDAVVRLYVNTGAISVNLTNGAAANNTYATNSGLSTFSNTCPMVINHLPVSNTTGGFPTGTDKLIAGCFLNRCPGSITLNGVTLAQTGNHPMVSCRCYYSSIDLKTNLAVQYIQENRNKKVVYRSVISNQTGSITSGSNYNQLVQSGITAPLGLIIMPFVNSGETAMAGFGPSGSPFDTNLAHPLSLSNLSVTLGGVNVLSTPLTFTFENFLEQVHLFESLTSSDIGVSCGVISKDFWNVNRVYYVNLGRGNASDNLTPRNIQVSFKNNNRVAIQCLMFVVYLDELEIDVETGLVKSRGLKTLQ